MTFNDAKKHRMEVFDLLRLEAEKINQQFPTEKDCVEEVRRRYLRRKKCPSCGCSRILRARGDRAGKCKRCRAKVWLTAGTIFEHVRAVKPYLMAIMLMETGLPLNASDLQKLVHTAYSTALDIFKTIMFVVMNSMLKKGLAVSSLGFNQIVCKRSSETPANEHPKAEQEELIMQLSRQSSDQAIDRMIETAMVSILNPRPDSGSKDKTKAAENKPSKDQSADVSQLCVNEKIIFKLMKNEPTSFDRLVEASRLPAKLVSGSLIMLELAQLVKSMPGDRFMPSAEALLSAMCPEIEDEKTVSEIYSAVNFIRRNYHGVSRKCLQLYLAAYWCFVDRKRWGKRKLLDNVSDFGQSAVMRSGPSFPRLQCYCALRERTDTGSTRKKGALAGSAEILSGPTIRPVSPNCLGQSHANQKPIIYCSLYSRRLTS